MSRNLSQIVAELFANPTEGKDLSAQIQRLGLEIKLVVQGEDTMFGKFRGLLESFREIIPDEQQRYHAAIKALSTTSKLSRQEIVKAMNGQLEELKIIEKNVIMPALPGWREELKAMEARLQGLKGEIANLRARLAQLEGEEKTVQAAMATRQKDLERAEKSIKDLFADIGAEITSVNKQVEGLPAEGPPLAQPTPPAPSVAAALPKEPVKSDAPAKKKKEIEQKVELQAASPPVDSKFQRKCPMCGGPLNLLQLENLWQCFTCAYEEPATDEVQETSEKEDEPMNTPTPAEAPQPASGPASFVEPLASMVNEPDVTKTGTSAPGHQPAFKKKTCPSCHKKMFWSSSAKAWRCPTCQHKKKTR
jgi:ribosomal protein L37AE/L43A